MSKQKDISTTKNEQPKTTINEEQSELETVQIGKQIWMKRNLNINRFKNGDVIQES